ncbi:hypothetical protein Pan44_33000 [Caulifigura coniformis]|uniref:Uncharacterized protein n=1 Tax=Caulifigura coniformis TaxID=2527983 RepID=A0A517SGP0_9PLAN|nr:hypothetical protein [Caulifigura coniformis]QDT55257.1 hypothetical protein Pan44_33000 [Caulifigura coniformis]
MTADIIAGRTEKSQSAAPLRIDPRRRFPRWSLALVLLLMVLCLGGSLLSRSTRLGGDDRFVGTWQLTGFGPPGVVSVARFHADGTVDIESVVETRPRFRQVTPWTWRATDGVLALQFDPVLVRSSFFSQLWFRFRLAINRVDLKMTIPLQIRSVEPNGIKLENRERRLTQPDVLLRRLKSDEAEELLEARMKAPLPAPPVFEESDESL